jgi:hypothetical protein
MIREFLEESKNYLKHGDEIEEAKDSIQELKFNEIIQKKSDHIELGTPSEEFKVEQIDTYSKKPQVDNISISIDGHKEEDDIIISES